MSKDIIIYQPWGGLGDNLQYSTLPKLYTELGYNVYISKSNSCRNKEIKKLVWDLNPYIKGESELPPNAGSCKHYRMVYEDNCMKNMELCHGLSNGNSKYPEIYYKPNKIMDLENTLVYDVTSISVKYSNEYIQTTFNSVFKKYPELKRKLVRFNNIDNINVPFFSDEIIEINNIYEYCDIISSCKVFVCLFSGNSVLASGIKGNNLTPEIYSFYSTPLPNQGKGLMFVFDNIHLNFAPLKDTT
jgi:hypothetical protein